MTTTKADGELVAFIASLAWPEGVPVPSVDVLLREDGETHLRFSDDLGCAVDASPGTTHITMLATLAALAERWVVLHGAEVGVYPTGIRGQILKRLDMRTAAKWLVTTQLSRALATAKPDR